MVFVSGESFRPFRQLYRIRRPVAFGAHEIMRYAVAGVAGHGVQHFAMAADGDGEGAKWKGSISIWTRGAFVR